MNDVLICFSLFFLSLNASASHRGSIGFYSKGLLDSDAQLTEKEEGLLKLFVERDRGHGNPVMIDLLTELGLAYRDEFPFPAERIQIGDISKKAGGLISRHASHQTGLDVDIVYLRNDLRETEPARGAFASFDETFVNKKRVVTANFDGPRNWWVLKWLYQSGVVALAFVDPAIKQFFVHHAKDYESDPDVIAGTLRMLWPYQGHDDHFHLRLVCPPEDKACVGMHPLLRRLLRHVHPGD